MIIELSTSGTKLSLYQGFLVINNDKRIPLDNIKGVIISNPAYSITGQLLSSFMERNIVLTICDNHYKPVGVLNSINTYTQAGLRARKQSELSTTLKNKLWQQVVKNKISKQKELLEFYNKKDTDRLDVLQKNVKSGDITNNEAQSAKIYWQSLFDNQMNRVQTNDDLLNSALNWGYTILRTSLMRRMIIAGLYPPLGIHHKSLYNNFALVDDLMEPYRPLVDFMVTTISHDTDELTQEHKKYLISILDCIIIMDNKKMKLSSALLETVNSYTRILDDHTFTIKYPKNFNYFYQNA